MARAEFRIVALELPVHHGRVRHTLGVVNASIAALPDPKPDLVVLPELALTGYVSPSGDFDLRRFAEPHDGSTALALAETARRHGVALAGPLVESEGAAFFNTLLLFDRTGLQRGHWRKRHPWVPEEWATPGNLGTPVVELEGVRITAGICYDIHFIVRDARESLENSDVFLFPSAWVEEPPSTRPALLAGLARRFRLTVVNANWGLSIPRLPGQGQSMIFDAEGKCVARAEGGGGVHVLGVAVPVKAPA